VSARSQQKEAAIWGLNMQHKNCFKRSTIAVALGMAGSSVSPGTLAQSALMEEVIVTATRRSQSTMDVPYNISAISAESLERTGVIDFSKLVQMVPGLAYIDQGPRDAGINSTLIMRGLNADPGIGSDVISLAAPTVSTYVDETPLFVNLHLYDLARVEVLRGPQGTLYGSGSLGGTIRYIHEKPDLTELSAQIDTRLSRTENAGGENYDLAAVVNIPVTDSFALRIAGG
jgi:outer membrane receptor protein involved in Fe transport